MRQGASSPTRITESPIMIPASRTLPAGSVSPPGSSEAPKRSAVQRRTRLHHDSVLSVIFAFMARQYDRKAIEQQCLEAARTAGAPIPQGEVRAREEPDCRHRGRNCCRLPARKHFLRPCPRREDSAPAYCFGSGVETVKLALMSKSFGSGSWPTWMSYFSVIIC